MSNTVFFKKIVKYAYLAFKYTYCFLKPIAAILARNLSLLYPKCLQSLDIGLWLFP